MPASMLRARNIRSHSALALSVSIALHVLFFYVVSRVPWGRPAPAQSTRVEIAWIRELRPASEPIESLPQLETEPEMEPDSRTQVEPVPAPAPTIEANEAVLAPDETGPVVEATSPPAAEQESDVTPGAAPSQTVPPALPNLPEGVDWEAERERAVAKVIDEMERAARYPTFSIDDLFPAPPPEEPGGPPPGQDIFASRSGTARGPALLQTGSARTKFGRWLSEICHDLSGGGIGLFGLASICTDPDRGADFFGHLRPAYMDKMPVCEKVQLARPLPDAAGIEEYDTVKCRLVAKSELPGLTHARDFDALEARETR